MKAAESLHAGRKARGLLAALLVVCLMATGSAVSAQRRGAAKRKPVESRRGQPQAKPASVSSQATPKPESFIPDVEVFDQSGRRRKFYTDLVKGKVVVINFIYTTCTAVCPLSGDNFSRLQRLLGDRLGRDVHLISVTTDPQTDSPAKLKSWSEKFSAKAGWTLVTGRQKGMTSLLEDLTGSGPRTGYHVPAVCIVNGRSGERRWTYGLEAPEELLKQVDALAGERAAR